MRKYNPRVYLLHLSRPVNDSRPARHYLGMVGDADRLVHRLIAHQEGRGAKMLRAAARRGISFYLAQTWHGGRKLEKKLKARKNAPKFCPICNRPVVAEPAPAEGEDLPFS